GPEPTNLLFKSPDLHKRTQTEQYKRTGTYEPTGARQHRLRVHESGCVGTNLEPELEAPPPSRREHRTRSVSLGHRAQCPATYREIRAFVHARHGFSPRTGWIAHVKDLIGLPLRRTHNRQTSTRVDPCPPERRAAIEEALRHFQIL